MQWIATLRRKYIPDYAFVPLLFLVLVKFVVYSGTKMVMGNAFHYNFETAFDLSVPFLPWTVLIYTGAFPYWFFTTILVCRYNKERAFRFLCADVIGELVCMLFFLFLPTTNTRPEVTGWNVFELTLRLIHAVDAPDNLFPSIHCLFSWLCFLAAAREPKLPKAYKVFSCIFSLMIFVSTMTTKQHILMDVLGGWLLAAASDFLCRWPQVTRFYYRLFDRDFAINRIL